MSDSLISSVTTVALAIIGVAIVAVILSKSANTANVLTAGSTAFSSSLGAALSPVTGGNSAVL